MSMTTMAPQPNTRVVKTIDTQLTPVHDNWMVDADRFLLPVTDTDATFWSRWAAVRYVEEQLAARVDSERTLLLHLRAFFPAEVRERLGMQAERLVRLVDNFNRVGRQRDSAREVAHTARELTEVLRLWYAEIEFAASGIRVADVSSEVIHLLAELNPSRCGWADANRC
jgi:hypothetical protein